MKKASDKRFPFLLKGDLVKVADELGVDHQLVRNVSCNRSSHPLIQKTLHDLNEARREQSESLSSKAVKSIIN